MTTTTTTTITQANVNNDWNEIADKWDDMDGPKQYRDCFITKLMKESNIVVEDGKNNVLTVVDFGCGTGLLTESLRKILSPNKSQFIMIDPAKDMIDAVRNKITMADGDGEWSNNNTEVYCIALANLDDSSNQEIKSSLEKLYGKVDIIVASSVMSFIPKQDLEATMKVLGKLLKSPNGIFVHTDWPKKQQADDKDNNKDDDDDGFTTDIAKSMYNLGGLECKQTEITKFKMGDTEEGSVFFGIAVKK